MVSSLGIQKDMGLDLHGMTVHSAWKKYRRTTEDCYHKKIKKITVVTGHGIMSAEFSGWVSADPYAVRCERQDPNKGAWTVHLKKNAHKPVENKLQPVDLTGLYKKFRSYDDI